MGRTFTGEDLPLEVQLSPVTIEDRTYLVAVSRDITERRKTDAAIRELNASLERRIEERTAELAASEARARTLVENAPEAIVVFDGSTGRFLVCNENAMTLYGLSREELLQRGPAEVSPEFQPDGRPSAIAAREKIQEALDGKAPVFEWLHKHSSGRLLPCEVRLVRLPAGDKPLVRGSVIDNTERRRREKIQQATYQISEAVHTAEDLGALYLRIHGIIKELMPAENFYIAMFDPVTELISFPYYVDEISPQPTPFKPNTGLTGYVLRTGKPMRMDRSMAVRKRRNGQLVSFDGFPEISYIESGTPAAIWMGVPLTVHGRPLGVMAVQDYRNEEAYGEEEMKILTFVAGQIALAIERKRAAQIVFQRAEQIQRHRNALLELALLDKSKLDLALETICARAATVLNVARVGYWSLKSDPAALECEVLYRLDLQATDASFKGTRVESTSCPAYFRALTSKEPIVANHVEFNPATEELIESYLNPLGISSMLDVPVWLNGKLVGVLCEEHTGEPRDWTSEEVDFAAAVANMVSLSLEAAQRARSEQALRESEEKFRALFEATSQGVILHDEDKFLELNPAAVRLLGHDNAAAIIGRHPADMSAPIQAGGESAATLSRKHIADCIAKGSTRFDWICRSGSGQEIQIEVILTRIQMAGRQIIQAVMNDISERKRAEAELLKSLAREKELGQLKSSFVSMVSHEFRTPLGIIMSSADILSDYFDRLDPDERRIHLESIHQNTRRMSELMEEVLLIGRLDAGKMDFKPAPVELPAFCRRLKDEIMAATEARCPIQLEITPECTEAHADERLLRHIFANLLTNAVKYSEHNTPIEFNMSRCGRDAVGVIRDRGIGIPESDQEWIFNAFHRARNVGQRPGTGLGLGIVKRCVELHGGRIRVESKVGEGTTMTVRLPVFAAE
jgi:PAS domain S-box-containing protein